MRRVCVCVCVSVCACVCVGLCVHLPACLPTACTQHCTEVLRDEVIGKTGLPGVHAAQPLWLVMMINVGKCHPVWCVTAHGLPLSTVQ